MKNEVCPEPTMKAGDIKQGFHVLRVETLQDMRMSAYEIEHEATGAKVLHLHCSDKENLYSIGFRTPPRDSSGIAHILEHAVLAGSEKYPVKDAFNELARGTMQTFINAFTYPDKTVYLVASQIKKDFFNLARVYTDLVLRPRLLRETFYQEGHHMEFVNPDDEKSPLTVSGIVFNEMKGVYSTPDSLMWKEIQETLYPDTIYAFDSGGNPEVIPFLTYEQLREFHRTFYSPSNAHFLIYGNIPTEEHLAFLDEMLKGFSRVPVDSRIDKQPRWLEPVRTRGCFPVGKEEDMDRKTTVNVAWMMADNNDPETVLLIKVVARALLGSAAGPLRKALIDSGMGEDLSSASGLETDIRQVAFVAGLRGTRPEMAERIESLILTKLEEIAGSDFDRDILEGALHQIEFSTREIIRKRYPYGITLLARIYHTWLYGGDPLVGLKFPHMIEDIRAKWASEPMLFRNVLKRWFIDNPHRVLSVMEPSRTYIEEKDEEFRSMMNQARSVMSETDRLEIARETEMLRRFQGEDDSQEARDSLPKLLMKDIPRGIEKLQVEKSSMRGVPVLRHDIFTNEIAYLNLAFDVSHVRDDLQPLLSLLGKLTAGMGAAGLGYDEMAKRLALKTGGIDCRLLSGMTADGRNCWQKFVISMRSLSRNIQEAVGILESMLLAGDLTDETRMRDLLLEKKNSLHASVLPSGHMFASRTAASSLSFPAHREEQWYGREQLSVLSRVSNHFETEKDHLRGKLQDLREAVLSRKRLLVNMTADERALKSLHDGVERLIRALPEGEKAEADNELELKPDRTGIIIPAQVCFVAKVFSAPVYSSPQAACFMVMSRLLSSGYLYKHIRVQGGAYGGMSTYDPMGGYLSFLSYRDPHLVETLEIYRKAADHLLREPLSDDEIEKAITGTIGNLDRPMDPEKKGFTSMIREFAGLTDEARQSFRDRVFETTRRRIRDAAERYLAESRTPSSVCVYASEENLRRANGAIAHGLRILTLT